MLRSHCGLCTLHVSWTHVNIINGTRDPVLKGLSIYYVIGDRGGEGSSPFITILHRGVLQSLLQYYRLGRNMEGLRPFSV